MTSKLKALGLAMVAIGAMSLLAASSSYAANGTVHIAASGGSASVTGTQDQAVGAQKEVFQLTASKAQTVCKDAHYEGTATDSSEPHQQTQVTPADLTITGIYTECETINPNSAATIDTNGCKYTLTPSETETTVTVDIVGCTTGKQIQITTNIGCTIDVPEQNGLNHITLTNVAGPPEYITAKTTIQGITYQPTGIFCILGQAQHTDGDYEGNQEFKAYEDTATQEQLTVNGHQFTRHVCGAQVNMFAT